MSRPSANGVATRKATGQFLESVTDREALKKQGYIPVDRWGKDHWNLLAYIGCRNTNNGCVLDGDHLRVNQTKNVGIPKSRPIRSWDTAWGTRLRGHFKNKNDLSLRLGEHDDIDCLDDMEAEGLITCGTRTSLYAQLTVWGRKFCAALNDHMQQGGATGNFEDSHQYLAVYNDWKANH